MTYVIHFVGDRAEVNANSTLMFAACKAGDERFAALTTDVEAVNCGSCKKHGIFLQALHKHTKGREGKISSRFFQKYEGAVILSEHERARLAHYGYWHWVKAMSMVRLWLSEEYDIDKVEQSAILWAQVLECIQRGDSKAIKAIAPKWHSSKVAVDDFTEAETSIADVNSYRKAGYKFPEFGSKRVVPTKNELYSSLNNSMSGMSNIENAINLTNDLITKKKQDVQEPLRSEVVSFELCCILAESVIMGHSRRVIEQELSDPRFLVHPSTMEKLLDQATALRKSEIVISVGSEANADQLETRDLNEFLFSCKWIDPSVVRLSVSVANEAKRRRNICQKNADNLVRGSELERYTRKVASVYISPRGILVDNFGSIRRIPYFELFEKLKNDPNFLSSGNVLLMPK